jgi:deazaflavin-dependent oxidoreductase (nitroreductase family)
MTDNDTTSFNDQVITEFRENGGKAETTIGDRPLVLVHHIGAKSGTERVAPLVPFLDGDRIFVFASKGGADEHPAWYHNLVAHPETSVEFGDETFPVRVRVVTGAERDEIYARQIEVQPQFGDYQRSTSRIIPVLELVRV